MLANEDIWIQHLGNVGSSFLFPRKLGNPRQILINSRSAYITGLRQLYTSQNLYVSLFSEAQKEAKIFHTLFMDFDNHNDGLLSDLEAEVYELFYWFKRKWKGEPRFVTSGRGFHLYQDFPLTQIDNYRNAVEVFYQFLIRYFGFDYFDRRIYNMNKITRLPRTINLKADKMCEWINPDTHQPSKAFGRYFANLSDTKIIREKSDDKLNCNDDLLVLWQLTSAITDGRKVLLWQMIIPRLRELNYTDDRIIEWCKDWVHKTGANSDQYQSYIISQLNVPTKPYKWSTFFYYNHECQYLRDEVLILQKSIDDKRKKEFDDDLV